MNPINLLPKDCNLRGPLLNHVQGKMTSAYSPMLEVLIGPKRTIWDDYDDELVRIARTYVSAHHDLIPYTRSFLYQATRSGMPVMRALVFSFPPMRTSATCGTSICSAARFSSLP
jgi:hypothetical protein